MTYCHFSSIVKRSLRTTRYEIRTTTHLRETLIVKRISFRSLDASRFTLHERRDCSGHSQAGC
jgi:hypothetical protein